MVEHGNGSIAVTLGAEPSRDFPASTFFMLFSLLIHRAKLIFGSEREPTAANVEEMKSAAESFERMDENASFDTTSITSFERHLQITRAVVLRNILFQLLALISNIVTQP